MNNETTPHGTRAADEATTAPTTETTASTEVSAAAPDAVPVPEAPKAATWEDLGLHPDVKLALDEMGYFAPTNVQATVYKPVSEGKDLLVQSRTGTGKTTAFGLPIISKIIPAARQPQAMILAPTRELALQVARELTKLAAHRGIIVEAVYGGAPIAKQIEALRDGVHIVVGTPGRVLDHIGRRTLDTRNITTFVLDECDEMLSMGFLEDIERVVATLPEKRQTLLFSATMPDEVTRYSRRHMKAPEQISLSRDSVSVDAIHHAYYIVSGLARGRDLLKIIFAENPSAAIIFCNTRGETTSVAKFLQKQGLDAEPLSSDLSQADRERVMARMKAHDLRFLCATDVAARGIDISDLSHVINYSVPESPEVYVHRTGRTGRAGKKGTALSLVGPRELGNFRYVRLTFGIKPEERVLPKDTIFEGKLKVPLPPVGAPQAPDPVSILIRGMHLNAAGPSDLERQIFEKLLSNNKGKAILTQLVAEKLNQITTTARPRSERSVREQAIRAESGEPRGSEAFAEGSDRPGRGGDRGDRPRFGGDRDRGPAPGAEAGAPVGAGASTGTDAPRRAYGDRPGFQRDGEAPRAEGAPTEGGAGGERPRFGGDRDRGPRRFDNDRPDRGGDRGDRGPRRFDNDRGDRGGRFGDRDRGPRTDGAQANHPEASSHEPAAPPAVAQDATASSDTPLAAGSTTMTTTTAAPTSAPASVPASLTEALEARPERTDREPRGDRGGRDRDRDRGGRDRDRGFRDDRGDRPQRDRVSSEAAPAAPAAAPAPIEAAPAPAPVHVEPAPAPAPDRGKSKRGGSKAAAPTAETREFWETWAEEKSTRVEEPKAAAPVAAAPASDEADEAAPKGRERGGRGRGGRDKRETKLEVPAAKVEADKPERAGRAKRDTTVDTSVTGAAETVSAGRAARPTPAAGGDASQARLFVSLGKKHGVSADDIRTLLAGPVGGDTGRIGSVSLRDSHAHVRVPEELVEKIIGGVHGTSHAEQSVTVERARA